MKIIKSLVIMFLLFEFLSIAPTLADEHLNLHSESAILIDAKTGLVLYEKNSKKQMYPASITKLVTGIVAIEEGQLEDEVTVSENARNVEGTKVYLNEAEVVTLHKLIQGLLINSGNDAGVAIAEHMDSTVEGFSERMNSFILEKVGVTDSSFVNPHGLFAEEHYTTAYDMAKIMRYAMQNEEFEKIIRTVSLPWKGETWETVLVNHHRMMHEIPYEGVIGGKNGYVQKSGFTLVTVAQRGETQLIAVTLQANGRNQPYQDTMALFDYGFKHYDTSLIPEFLYMNQSEIILPEKLSQPVDALKMVESERKLLQSNEHPDVSRIVFLSLVIAGTFLFVLFIKIRKNKQFYL
ncbi:D-alanyl-D-alanine carboxypeptidase family protein [Bacillus sp. AK128]